jgi:hypothetical protein
MLIAHRGNLNGPNPELENTPSYIEFALENYACEIDLWVVDNKRLMLGHDGPSILIAPDFLHRATLFVHCKNREALIYLSELRQVLNFEKMPSYFVHDREEFVFTSKGQLWCYPSKRAIPYGVNLMPEIHHLSPESLVGCAGICSDYIANYGGL